MEYIENGRSLVCCAVQELRSFSYSDDFKGPWPSVKRNVSAGHYLLGWTGCELYDGSAGILYFLLYAARLLKDEILSRETNDALAELLNLDIEEIATSKGIGVFIGLSGFFYVALHAYALNPNNRTKKFLSDCLSVIRKELDRLTINDVIDGKAGVLLVVLSYYEFFKDTYALETAKILGELLLQTAIREQGHVGWIDHGAVPWGGFGHGVTGISYAMFRLFQHTASNNIFDVAYGGFIYEDSLFNADLDTWRDLRFCSIEHVANAWCNGAPGIGHARYRIKQIFRNLPFDESIRAAEIACRKPSRSDCLCHGTMGNLELLMDVTANHKDRGYATYLNDAIHEISKMAQAGRWRCGNSWNIKTFGLMTGIAGIGFQAARIVSTEFIPSLLLLEPPSLPF